MESRASDGLGGPLAIRAFFRFMIADDIEAGPNVELFSGRLDAALLGYLSASNLTRGIDCAVWASFGWPGDLSEG